MLLGNLHKGFEILCMPGFATLASLNDMELLRRQPKKGTKLLMSSALRMLAAYCLVFILSDVVAFAYLHGDLLIVYACAVMFELTCVNALC